MIFGFLTKYRHYHARVHMGPCGDTSTSYIMWSILQCRDGKMLWEFDNRNSFANSVFVSDHLAMNLLAFCISFAILFYVLHNMWNALGLRSFLNWLVWENHLFWQWKILFLSNKLEIPASLSFHPEESSSITSYLLISSREICAIDGLVLSGQALFEVLRYNKAELKLQVLFAGVAKFFCSKASF